MNEINEDDYYSGDDDYYNDEDQDYSYRRRYDDSEDDEASVQSDSAREVIFPSQAFRRMPVVLETPPLGGPKYAILKSGPGGGQTTEQERVIEIIEAKEEVVAPPKPAFSWGKPVAVQAAPLDMASIFAEQEAQVLKELERPPRREFTDYPRRDHPSRRDQRGGYHRGEPRDNRDHRDQRGGYHRGELRDRNHRDQREQRGGYHRGDQRDHRENRDHRDQRDQRGGYRGESRDPNRRDDERRPSNNERLLTNPNAPRLVKNEPPSSTSGNRVEKEHGGRRTDLLCIHPANHSTSCNLCHSWNEWVPKHCKFHGAECTRGQQCSYWHKNKESKQEYLTRALRQDILFFRKHKAQYMKTYKIVA